MKLEAKFHSLPPIKSLVLTCLPVLFLTLGASSSSSSPLISLHIYVTVPSCQRDPVLDPLLPFPSLLTLDNFTPGYMQSSKVSCADNSLILFSSINLTSLSSSSVHCSARSLLMSSYQFTLHGSQHHSLFLPWQIFPFISFSHSTMTVLLILAYNFSPFGLMFQVTSKALAD